MIPHARRWIGALAVLAAAACGGPAGGDAAAPGTAPANDAQPVAAPATGKVIDVKLITDDTGNRFEPADLTASTGDVLRFTLVSGVHNVHFLPDSNPGATGLPEASEMLQLPGQTLDVPVSFAPGAYYFQCDPHAPLGMIGHLTVGTE